MDILRSIFQFLLFPCFFLLNLFYARCRRIDVAILWPAIVKKALENESVNADAMTTARCLFMFHCMKDHAWDMFNEEELVRFISELK